MKTLAGTVSKARLQALGFIATCTLLGWTGALFGHATLSPGVRALLILAVVTCAMGVVFTSIALADHSYARADAPFYNWRAIPLYFALALMITLFAFGVSTAGIGFAALFAFLAPIKDPAYVVADAMRREEALDAERLRFRPKVLEATAPPEGEVTRPEKP